MAPLANSLFRVCFCELDRLFRVCFWPIPGKTESESTGSDMMEPMGEPLLGDGQETGSGCIAYVVVARGIDILVEYPQARVARRVMPPRE